MKFTKMQGIGNDYVYVNCFEEKVEDPAALAKFVSDRHFGIGSDRDISRDQISESDGGGRKGRSCPCGYGRAGADRRKDSGDRRQ